MDILPIGFLLFPAAGIFSIFIKEDIKGYIFSAFIFASQFFILPVAIRVLLNGNKLESVIKFSAPIGNSIIRIDPLSAFFVIIISIGALLTSIYSIGYMKHYGKGKYSLSSYYFFLGILITSMLLVVTVQNALLFLVVWEIMSLSSFFLVMFENDKADTRKAGIYYLVAMQVGVSFLIAAFAWTSNLSGGFNFDSFKNILSSDKNSVLIFLLFFMGFGMKAGFVPFHTWLPKAHPAAPSGVSAVMSGVMIKTGIYGILRMIQIYGTPDIILSYFIFGISFITGIIGILNSTFQKDMKKMLAYSSIENIGIIGMGIGLGMLGLSYHINEIAFLGFLAALLHIFNHFTFKSVLFYGAGTVYLRTHTRNIEKLGGLIKFIPLTTTLFLFAALAISGLPLLNGFVGEFALYLGMAKSFSTPDLALNITMLIGFSGLSLIGVTAFIAFTKIFGIGFLGVPRDYNFDSPDNNKENFFLFIPMLILVCIIIFIGLFPYLIIPILGSTLTQLTNMDISIQLSSVTALYNWMSNVLIILSGLILFFFGLRYLLIRKNTVSVFKTWDCGYQAESARIQYTGTSYSMPFLNLMSGLVPKKTTIRSHELLFPTNAYLESSAKDFAESFFIQPVIKYLEKFLKAFAWIQSGRLQQYILYGLIFLIILLVWVIGIS